MEVAGEKYAWMTGGHEVDLISIYDCTSIVYEVSVMRIPMTFRRQCGGFLLRLEAKYIRS
ncbi:hypothetical protein Cpin_6544 [Chitinophaga pinensis DSM 2588]|uniref:Uncharacterized protein n=1 Tax=Chitinophaga pinensis (strain ATCC 43595 / DSM 2588 / LMG 13176 / NBRC 15968 / NCIMB 11800 / UQM 2034) TaxID=485918 RepID=A0A979GW91_CHIPD|nr:hypothetical protein Cpin_6544 [Chitinophaga pinensis DSM 2588]